MIKPAESKNHNHWHEETPAKFGLCNLSFLSICALWSRDYSIPNSIGILILIVHMYMPGLTQYSESSLRLRDETVWPEPTVYLVHVLLAHSNPSPQVLACLVSYSSLAPNHWRPLADLL